MIIRNWPAAVAHIDADCFYATCEQLRRPELRCKPLCVLSSQDACVVAKTYDAKAAGIRTGMPVWEARRIMPSAVFLPADFRFYGQLSEAMFGVLRRFSPLVEPYSIDEGFVDLDGLRAYWRRDYVGIAEMMRQSVQRETGLVISIGVAVNKTLAKMASEAGKPDGLTCVPGRHITAFLDTLPVAAIPGIGSRRRALLAKFGIQGALDFALAPESLIRRLLGRQGLDLWHELNGRLMFCVSSTPSLPKSVARTASLGKRTRDARIVRAALSGHAFRLAMRLIGRGLEAQHFTVMLRLGNFDRISQRLRLPRHSSDVNEIQRAAAAGFRALWRAGMEVNGCGIVASRIKPADHRQGELFAPSAEAEQLPLWQAVHAVRQRFGHHSIQPAIAVTPSPQRPRFVYPLIRAG